VSTFDIISVLIGSIGMILIQGSTGAILGYGVFKRNLIIPISLTLVLHVIFHYLLFELVFTWTWILFFGGIISYLISMQKIVYPVLDQSKRRKRRTDNKHKIE
jgi:hypothetical protein